MTTASELFGRPVSRRVQDFFWTHPEWWSLGLSGAAWAALIVTGWSHAGHEAHIHNSYLQELWHWMLMVVAMMLPFSLGSIRYAAFNSLHFRRHRAVAGFLIGYLAPWLAMGIVVAAVRGMRFRGAASIFFAAAGLWIFTALYRRAIARCHAIMPLAPEGRRADADCVRFGIRAGSACVGSCWLLMIGCTLTGHALLSLAGGVLVSGMERWHFWPKRREAAGVCGVLAAVYLFAATI